MEKINLKQIMAEIEEEAKHQNTDIARKLTQDEIRQMLKAQTDEGSANE